MQKLQEPFFIHWTLDYCQHNDTIQRKSREDGVVFPSEKCSPQNRAIPNNQPPLRLLNGLVINCTLVDKDKQIGVIELSKLQLPKCSKFFILFHGSLQMEFLWCLHVCKGSGNCHKWNKDTTHGTQLLLDFIEVDQWVCFYEGVDVVLVHSS